MGNIKGWVRGRWLGAGSGGSVSIAMPTKGSTELPSPVAVKSCEFLTSLSLKDEEDILYHLRSCPHVINCYGHDHNYENGKKFFHIFLEYASGGTLFDHLDRHGGKFCEGYTRKYTRSILQGLKEVHDTGFVHCDLKLENILVFDNEDIKIADFGLAKRIGEINDHPRRGTPMILSPEAVNDNQYEPPADIWALGCAVFGMLTGQQATWPGHEFPDIPQELSQEGQHFLRKCFVRDPKQRWTAAMLLNHPFILNVHQCSQCNPSRTTPTPTVISRNLRLKLKTPTFKKTTRRVP